MLLAQDDGRFVTHSGGWYCDDCLAKSINDYEASHTPAGKLSSSDFLRKIVQFAKDQSRIVYSLQHNQLAPRGIPTLGLILEKQFRLVNVKGDVVSRYRAFKKEHLPARTLLFSPGVPEKVRNAIMNKIEEPKLPHTVTFLYMDEKYIDAKAPPECQVTSLTGLLVSADIYPVFRDRLFRLLPGFSDGLDRFGVEVHAKDLFRDRPEEQHFEFYSGLVFVDKRTRS